MHEPRGFCRYMYKVKELPQFMKSQTGSGICTQVHLATFIPDVALIIYKKISHGTHVLTLYESTTLVVRELQSQLSLTYFRFVNFDFHIVVSCCADVRNRCQRSLRLLCAQGPWRTKSPQNRSKFFSLRVDPYCGRSKIENYRVASPESVPIHPKTFGFSFYYPPYGSHEDIFDSSRG